MDNFEVLRAMEDEATEETSVVEVEGGKIIFEPGQSDDTAIKLDIEPEQKSSSLKDKLIGMAIGAGATTAVVLVKKGYDWFKSGKEKKAKKKEEMEAFERWRKAQQDKEKSDAVDVNYEDVKDEAETSETKEPEKKEPEKEKEQPKENKKK